MSVDSEPAVIPAIVPSDLVVIEHGTGKRSLIGCFDGLFFSSASGSVLRNAWVSNIEWRILEI